MQDNPGEEGWERTKENRKVQHAVSIQERVANGSGSGKARYGFPHHHTEHDHLKRHLSQWSSSSHNVTSERSSRTPGAHIMPTWPRSVNTHIFMFGSKYSNPIVQSIRSHEHSATKHVRTCELYDDLYADRHIRHLCCDEENQSPHYEARIAVPGVP